LHQAASLRLSIKENHMSFETFRSWTVRDRLAVASLAAAGCVAACSSGPSAGDGAGGPLGVQSQSQASSTSMDAGAPVRGGMHVASSARAVAASPTPGLVSYYGGSIISQPSVVTVNWNAAVASQAQGMPVFYDALTTSKLWTWLDGDYATTIAATAGSKKGTAGTGQHILTSGGDPIVHDLGQATTTISDSTVQAVLQAAFQNKTLPQPDGSTVYMINLPPHTVGQHGGVNTCVPGGFCAWHAAFTYGTTQVYYAIIADQSIDCFSQCGSDPNYFNNMTMVATHELVETVTDPSGENQNYPSAWDGTTPESEVGEIGGCGLVPGTIADPNDPGQTYTVQKIYDNATGNCIACKPLTCQQAQVSCGTTDDGCGGTLTCGSPCPPPLPFTIAANATSLTLAAGGVGGFSVWASADVTFSIGSAPAGVQTQVFNSQYTVGGQDTLVTVTVPAAVHPQNANLIVSATNGSQTESLDVPFTITACVPGTCASQGATCGTTPDGCGGTLNCGACPTCQPPKVWDPNLGKCDVPCKNKIQCCIQSGGTWTIHGCQ
jgi:hypothetical protein